MDHTHGSQFRLRFTQKKRDADYAIGQESGWFEFRFINDVDFLRKFDKKESCATFVLPNDSLDIFKKDIRFEVKTEALVAMSEKFLERRVFEAPVFFDQRDQGNPSLDAVVSLLHVAAPEGLSDSETNVLDKDQFLSSVLSLIVLNWPSTDSEEIGLCPAIRPPAALRQALAYIAFRRGFVENVEDVASNSGSGLRTLESLFGKWLDIGIARYAKMTRLRMLISEMQITNTPLSELAKRYCFSNVTRLRRELVEFDYQTANDLEPRNFYSRLKAP